MSPLGKSLFSNYWRALMAITSYDLGLFIEHFLKRLLSDIETKYFSTPCKYEQQVYR